MWSFENANLIKLLLSSKHLSSVSISYGRTAKEPAGPGLCSCPILSTSPAAHPHCAPATKAFFKCPQLCAFTKQLLLWLQNSSQPPLPQGTFLFILASISLKVFMHFCALEIFWLFEISDVHVLFLDSKLLEGTWTSAHKCVLLGHDTLSLHICSMNEWIRAVVLKECGHQDHLVKHRLPAGPLEVLIHGPRICILNGFPDGAETTQHWEALP